MYIGRISIYGENFGIVWGDKIYEIKSVFFGGNSGMDVLRVKLREVVSLIVMWWI
jgi:hypothetical protein